MLYNEITMKKEKVNKMKLKELANKIEKLNELNKQLELDKQHYLAIYFKNETYLGDAKTLKEAYELIDYETDKEEIDKTELEKINCGEYKLSYEWEACGKTFKTEYKVEVI